MTSQPRYSDRRSKDKKAFENSVIFQLSDDNPFVILPMGYSNATYVGERIINREGILEVTTKGERFLPYSPGTRAICTHEGCVMIDKNGRVTVEVYAEPKIDAQGFVQASSPELCRLEDSLRFNGEKEIESIVQTGAPWGFHTTAGTIMLSHKRKKEPILRGKNLRLAVQTLAEKYEVQLAPRANS